MKPQTKLTMLSLSSMIAATAALADDIEILCYQDGNECEVLGEMAQTFESATGHNVTIDTVGYEVIRDQLLNQAQAGNAPDIARVTNPGAFGRLALDLTPYVDTAYWEENYGALLPWFRAPGGEDKGIYGWNTQLTVTGPYVNVTAFDDAGVELPGDGATWDEWAAAAKEVQDALGLTAGLVMDRTAHRWAGPAFSYGAQFFGDDGEPLLVDDGFRNFAEVFIGWHKSGLMPAEGWPAGSGTQYRNAAPLFVSGDAAMHMSGSWMINNYAKNIQDFEWRAVPAPCGVGGCGAMPGGASLVVFGDTEVPEAAAAFVDWMAQTEQAEKFASETNNITAHAGLQASGVDYQNATPTIAAALSTFASNAGVATKTTPQAYVFQGYSKNFAIYGIVPDYITKAITGEMSLDDALSAIDADVAAKIAE
ncbi:ABC transporter substrate-binding protein [Cognatishimia activa]|uniref:Carbohydrate ABC transporter, N-acetylglucosamine/diacetylchitobiose-binding protein n=1 Tax=Cognatishimia activa TaxID=1715691 RepID=A0A0P1IR29_9RHOB|nr:extracellular solute-binding protein [Cognatishimia activa]MEE2945427.1 extracellular solute-binding protein [Pseudomonadota bacterium]CUI97432.1 carbohydrate ABC transporter, N-acetylglucosamine/diacetylchitobiose-binding protein [Cognatishimia activa]CUK25942.1 carbohydrate ABC transporter, N-acetylglucosamine/diacetylchitobiose-binding protein [Cognatishimia activa]